MDLQIGAKAVAIGALMVSLLLPLTVAAQNPGDTSENAMIQGGCYSRQECADGIRQLSSARQNQFAKYGITPEELLSSDTVNGKVTQGGRVILTNGTVVATDAYSYGHSFIEGSNKVSSGLYKRPTSVSFQSSSLDALIHMHGDTFQWAVIKSCGNVVTATPNVTVSRKAPTPQPAPQPAPSAVTPPAPAVHVVQVQTQSQQQTTPPPAPAPPAPAPAPAPPPPAPTPLPAAGTAAAASLVGLSGIFTSGWYYLRSRRRIMEKWLER